ncbi:MAG: PAS domain S-box protein, partial [Syntrophorhabdaceae bacterium]|nr:PAS domain S-box protein [Syntrophorhabdaceae bacterium]
MKKIFILCLIVASLLFSISGPSQTTDDFPKRIKVVIDDNYPPYVFRDHEGKLIGISIDLWQLWQKKTGISVDIYGMDWGEALRRMKAGEFDVIDTIFFTEERAKIYDYSKPYAKINVSIFFHKDISGITDADTLRGFVVAVKKGDDAIDYLRDRGITTLMEFPSYEAIINAMKEKKVNVAIIDDPPAHYFLNKKGILEQIRHSQPLYTGEFHRAVKKGNKAILELVEDGFSKISKKEFQAIHQKWFGIEHEHFFLRPYLRQIAIVLVVIILIVLFLFIWNYTLRKKVRERTFALEKEMALKAEAMDRLKQSEERYRSIFENAVEGIFQTTPEGKIVAANPAWARLYGFDSPEDALRSISNIEQLYINPKDRMAFKHLLETKKEVKNFEMSLKRKDGTSIWVNINARAVRDKKGDVIYYEGTAEDITEKKKREEEIIIEHMRNSTLLKLYQMSDEPLERITDFVLEQCIIITGSEYGFIGYLNEEETLMHASLWSKKAMDVCSVDEKLVLFPIDKAGLWAETVRQKKPIIVNDYNEPNPYKKGFPKGHVQIERFLGIPLLEKDRVRVVIGLANKKEPYTDSDILHISLLLEGMWSFIKKKQMEDDLRASEERYRTVIESSNDAIVIVKDGRHVFVNKRFYELTGYSEEEVIGNPIDFWIHPDDREKVFSIAVKRQDGQDIPSRYEFRGIHKDGSIIHIEVSASKIVLHNETMALAFLRDVTDLKRTEAQLIQSQKMEAIGRLAGGIAHDFNNMLTVILGHTQLALLTLDPSNPLYQRFVDIQKAAQRSAELTKNLLAFARKQTVVPRVLNINHQIEEMLKMIGRLIGENIELIWLPDPHLWNVKIDPSQLNQVIINIIINAKDAIDHIGTITIETKNVIIDETYCKTHLGFIPGEYAMLAISDNGIGMDKETLEHIFEPFFTTKTPDKGSGLGLSTVYGIVKQNNGFINVYSEPKKGSTFKIYLPRHRAPKEETPITETDSIIRSKGETILLVEDEKEVLELCTSMLGELG